MICFHQTRGHAYTLRHVRRSPSAPPIRQGNYDQLLRARSVPRGTQVFTDLERLGPWDLELAAGLYLQMKQAGLPVWNNPARFKNRHSLLRTLHRAGLNDFDAYRVHGISAIRRYPVFLRKIQNHRSPVSDLLHTPAEVAEAVDRALAGGTPEENLVVIEYLAEPVRPGFYRRFSCYRVGPDIVPYLTLHDRVWLVKYGVEQGLEFDGIEDVYREEHALIEQACHAEHLRRVFEIAGVEYGRADYGLYQGRIQVFEINTNPHLDPPEPHASATRAATMKLVWNNYLAALRRLDSPGGPRVPLADGIKKHRAWKYLFVRTRKAP